MRALKKCIFASFVTIQEFEKLYQSLAPFVFKLAYSPVLNKEDAEEIVQDVFLIVFDKHNQFRGVAQLKTWIYKITYRKIQDYFKALNRKKRTFDRTELAKNIEEIEHNQTEQYSSNPSSRIIHENLEFFLYEVLNTLNQEQQWVFRLSWELKLSNQEISEILSKSIKAVESIRFRTMSKIKEQLSQKFDQIYGDTE